MERLKGYERIATSIPEAATKLLALLEPLPADDRRRVVEGE
jgi:hypothetical protein